MFKNNDKVRIGGKINKVNFLFMICSLMIVGILRISR